MRGGNWTFGGSGETLKIPGELQALATDAEGWTVVSQSTAAVRQNGLGMVAFHEAIHLLGIELRDKKYEHPECAFSVDNAARERQGLPQRGDLGTACTSQ